MQDIKIKCLITLKPMKKLECEVFYPEEKILSERHRRKTFKKQGDKILKIVAPIINEVLLGVRWMITHFNEYLFR